MNLREAERLVQQELYGIYQEGEAAAIAGLLLEHLTSLNKTARLARSAEAISAAQDEQLRQSLARLKNHEPFQYITNHSPFYGLNLYVDNRVLIPRPETEELVDWIVQDCRLLYPDAFMKGRREADETKTLKILDVGTGSGCIALALKKVMPKAEVWGCDSSEEALNVARRNGSDLDIRVDYQGLNFLDPAQQKRLPTVHILVSNPPYIPVAEAQTLDPNVVKYEPHQALFVPDEDPLLFYKSILQFSGHRLYSNGRMYMEIHEDLSEGVMQLFRQAGMKEVELKKDLSGKNRMIRVNK
jgi:release factor glutamine methyltransferase